MQIRRLIFSRLLIASLLLLAGCGYYNPYVVNSGADPITVHHSIWQNQTNELGLETTIYQTLANWMRRGNLIIIKEKKSVSQYSLNGKIISIDYPEISYGGNNVATELRARLTVAYELLDNRTGKPVWQQNKTYAEELKQSSNPSQLRTNKKEALAEIADDIAEEIYLHIVNKVLRK